MPRPRKPEIGSSQWARNELKIAEKRLRDVRRLIQMAADDDLPALLRLETSLRRECERLARAAEPSVVTDFFGAPVDLEDLERAALGQDGDD